MNAVMGKLANAARVMIVGADQDRLIEKRLRSVGCEVWHAARQEDALDYACHQPIQAAVLLEGRSLLDTVETAINLRDLSRIGEIIIVVKSGRRNRSVRQLLDHPIEGSSIVTRRQLPGRLRNVLELKGELS